MDTTTLKLEMEMAFGWAMSVLNEKERVVVERRIAYEDRQRTFSEIGLELSCTRERVRQMEQKAFRKMRNYLCGPMHRNYGTELSFIIEELNNLNRCPSTSRKSLPSGYRYIPQWTPSPKLRKRRRKLDLDTDDGWITELFKSKVEKEIPSFRTKQPYKYDLDKVPWIDGQPCIKLAKTWYAKRGRIKYVHFEENKRFSIYKSLEKKGWRRDDQGIYYNPKSGQVRSIVFCHCHWKKGWVWMNVCFSSSF